ncbi:ABC transporter [Dactylonectria estremocensis]|uniref:ABC transporter n=1 Tax=Dactylonectria estremocensis TaxID=1079267 RepID=A0A9P9IR40_9HYPO|nr:ABC transporter [Dactylonectria estremocensis]
MACGNDDAFGPVVQGCRGNFDFTLQFEGIFFSILPSSLFLVLGLGRFLWLLRRPNLAAVTAFLWAKIAVIVVFAALQLAQLVLTAQHKSSFGNLSVPSDVLRFAVSVIILLLSFAEHKRAPRPSVLLGCFLFSTLLFDIVRTRTLWLIAQHDLHHDAATRAKMAVAMTVLKGVVLVLEAQHKRYAQDWKDHHSPEETSGIFSLSTYTWLDRLFLSGFRSLLSVGDLYALDQTMSASRLQAKVNQRWIKGSPSQELSRRMLTTLAAPLLLPVIPRLAVIGFTFCQPFLMETILAHLQSSNEPSHGYGLIGAAVIVYTGVAISNALYFYWQERFVCMVRGVLFTAVYDKTISLPTAVAADSAALTLMNSDIERIKMGLLPLHEYWANIVELALACWLLEQKLGAAFAAPIVVVILCILASAGIASITGRRQVAWMKAIEERVAATATTISSMKPLRISGMVAAVEKLIQGLRENEIRIGAKWRLMLVVAVTLSYTPMTIGPLMAFAVTSRTLEVTRIFPAMAFITLLAAPLVSLFQNIPGLMSAIACLGRIDAYMRLESRVDTRTRPRHDSFAHEKSSESKEVDELKQVPALEVTAGEFGWAEGNPVLKDINLTIPFSSLTIVVGPVASGKSTLLKALLGETTHSSGAIALGANFRRIGYCDQTPFLSNDTIRANIIGHAQFDATRYQQVLHAASLAPDLRQLPQGDRTNIGGSGISLSGGQKQRVALARALYLEADLYLFDDILSGLDASTSSLVFQRTLGPRGLLARRKATVVLCTHDERYLPFADNVLAISGDGLLTAQGTVEELVAAGKIQNDAKAVESDKLPDQEKEEALDYASEAEHSIDTDDSDKARQQDGSRQLGDFAVYRHYFSSMANWVIVLLVLSCCCFGFTSNFPTVWLKYWSADAVRPSPTQSGAFYIGIYALLQTTCLLSLMAVVLLCTQSMISQTGSTLHQRALRTVVGAPLRFFALVDAGTVTNLFAQDLTLIDSELPLSLLNFALSLFSLVGMAAVIATASPWLAVAYPFLIGVVYYIQLFYLRTSRQLRLLDLESKAPLYAHFIDTLSGLVTLRALGHIDASMATSNSLLDTSQRPAYLLAMIQRWLQLVLRLIVMVIATIIITLATQLRTDSGFTGATLLTLMNFGDMLATIVQSYTTLETSIGAVARLKTFSSSTESESQPDVEATLDNKWPQRGQIEIKDVSASYSGEESPDKETMALRGVSITFNAGERVAIVGRTGSGKSSLILLLLRLLDPLQANEGITVDGLPLENMHREVVRRRVIAISQDPIFLPSCSGSTLRSNLDPFREASDDDLLHTLKMHGLDFLTKGEDGSESLDCFFSPTSLSQGQKQLFNLARAVVRRGVRRQAGVQGGILLLDEVSSSVDSRTDDKMWDIIQDEFAGYTVIMIAHRLDLAMKCDRVVVMNEGRVAESGQPDDLRCQEGGLFKALLETRESMS